MKAGNTLRAALVAVALAGSAVVVAAADNGGSKPHNNGMMAVEPYMAAWCAKQFPEQITSFTGFDMHRLITNHVKIEPYLGEWCFDQFHSELAPLDRTQSIQDLQHNHVTVETYLQQWSQRSIANLEKSVATDGEQDMDIEDIEPYLGEWCVEQFPEHLRHLSGSVYDDVQQKHVKWEPVLARWCFAQFPSKLQDMDTPQVVADINNNHELVENQLMQWSLTTRTTAGSSTQKSSSGGSTAAIVILSIGLVASLSALVFVVVRERRSEKEYDGAMEIAEEEGENRDSSA